MEVSDNELGRNLWGSPGLLLGKNTGRDLGHRL